MPRRKSGTRRTNSESVANLAKRDLIVDLRLKGHSYPAIAKEVELSTGRVYQIVQEYVQEYREKHAEKIEHMIELEGQRIDRLMAVLWTRFEQGETPAASLILKALERRAKMLGMDKEEKSQVEMVIKGYRNFSPDEAWPNQEA
jgi:DNA-directed RNA polymerase specialized sigma subunit